MACSWYPATSKFAFAPLFIHIQKASWFSAFFNAEIRVLRKRFKRVWNEYVQLLCHALSGQFPVPLLQGPSVQLFPGKQKAAQDLLPQQHGDRCQS
jgi:hypothetical protein